VGRGMIQGVSHQLFQQFAAAVTRRLEAAAPADGEAGGAVAAPVATEATPIRVVPLLLKTLWAAIVNFFRRLFGKPTGPGH